MKIHKVWQRLVCLFTDHKFEVLEYESYGDNCDRLIINCIHCDYRSAILLPQSIITTMETYSVAEEKMLMALDEGMSDVCLSCHQLDHKQNCWRNPNLKLEEL